MATGLASFDAFVQGLTKGSLPDVCLLHGAEEFLVEQAAAAVIDAALSPAERQFNLDVVRAGEMDIREILALCASFPMMTERRVVVLRELEKLGAKDLELLAGYLDSPSPSTCLVLVGARVDMRRKPFNAFRKHHPVLECKQLYEDQAPRWIEARVRAAGKTIGEEATRLLVAYVGTSLRALDAELTKLAIFVGSRDVISPEDVSAAVGVSREFTVFELQRCLGAGDSRRAVVTLERLLEGGETPVFLLVMLTSYFVALWKIQELTRKNTPRAAIASEARVNPYFLGEYLAGAKRFAGPEIEQALCLLAEADASLKTTQADPRQLMHTLLARLLNGKTPDHTPA